MPTPRSALVGTVLVYLVVLLLALDGLAQLLQPGFMVAIMEGSQIPLAMAPLLGAITLSCAVILAIPRLAPLGAVLVTGFLGGAIAIHFRLGEFGTPPQVICLALGLATWVGLYLRDARIRAVVRAPA
ncbi:DoxX family protein [Roseococcus thiosulfatophilus]|uniref:DoxX family protein n=1 Tax=Roseococcus thiosulfatophilus TaxID=35813 RepID=UPI001A8EDC86|nr:DoxX family protein [Roseococcus thiosulfatophilus]